MLAVTCQTISWYQNITMTRKKNINDLPPEVLIIIFEKLDQDHVIENCTTVCKNFENTIRSRGKWSHKAKITEEMPLENLTEFLERWSALKVLILTKNPQLSDVDFTSCPYLEKVVFQNVRFRDVPKWIRVERSFNREDFHNISKDPESVTKIDLVLKYYMGQQENRELLGQKFKNLETLEIDLDMTSEELWSKTSFHGLFSYVNSLKNCQKLNHMIINLTSFSDARVFIANHIFRILGPMIKKLELNFVSLPRSNKKGRFIDYDIYNPTIKSFHQRLWWMMQLYKKPSGPRIQIATKYPEPIVNEDSETDESDTDSDDSEDEMESNEDSVQVPAKNWRPRSREFFMPVMLPLCSWMITENNDLFFDNMEEVHYNLSEDFVDFLLDKDYQKFLFYGICKNVKKVFIKGLQDKHIKNGFICKIGRMHPNAENIYIENGLLRPSVKLLNLEPYLRAIIRLPGHLHIKNLQILIEEPLVQVETSYSVYRLKLRLMLGGALNIIAEFFSREDTEVMILSLPENHELIKSFGEEPFLKFGPNPKSICPCCNRRDRRRALLGNYLKVLNKSDRKWTDKALGN